MFKKLFIVLFYSLLVVSCTYFENKWERESIQVIDTVVDFNTVDAFPLFPNCKDIPSREKQKICFQIEIAQHIYASLKEYQLNATEIVNDTILVKLKVNVLGRTSLSEILISDKTKEQLPEFDSILKVSLQNLPTLKPAIKRDMPVTTEFTLPIILKN
ncbi:MAG: hypothetical protein QM495_00150 [Lutibacter sp.]|uniref:hypothetical protein n=1 Tax=Lutibacter sp. TaxID=1925666 RepID=UPI00385AE74C